MPTYAELEAVSPEMDEAVRNMTGGEIIPVDPQGGFPGRALADVARNGDPEIAIALAWLFGELQDAQQRKPTIDESTLNELRPTGTRTDTVSGVSGEVLERSYSPDFI